MKQKLIILAGLFLFSPAFLFAASSDPITMETHVLDIPTADVLDPYQISFSTRTYDHGTFMESIDCGIYPRINIGVSLAVHELLGSSESVRVLNPDFQAKWEIYSGNLYLPAIAIGYDGRRYGYGYDQYRHYTHTKKYLDNRKGGYLTLSREIMVPGLKANAGINFSDFEWSELYVFAGFFYRLSDQVGLFTEWDNIRKVRDSRLNAGLRIYLHPSLSLDGAVRRIGRGDESERIIQLRYVTNF